MDTSQSRQASAPAQRPSKEQVREWMMSRLGKREPPPAPDQLRRLLGWSDDTPAAGA